MPHNFAYRSSHATTPHDSFRILAVPDACSPLAVAASPPRFTLHLQPPHPAVLRTCPRNDSGPQRLSGRHRAFPSRTLPAATEPAKPFSTSRPAATLATRIKFNFKDVPVDNLLDYLATSFDFVIIKRRGHRQASRGRVTVNAKNDVTADEAVAILDSVLKPYNLGLLRTDKVLRLMLATDEKKVAQVFYGNKSEEIKPTDELRTQIIPLYTLDPVKLKQDLASMLSTNADVVANTASNTLVVTDTASNVRHLVEVIAIMDKQALVGSDIKVFKLKYGNSSTTAKLINDVFGTPTGQSGGGTGGTGGGGAGGRGGRGGAGGGGAGGGFPGFGGGGGGFPGLIISPGGAVPSDEARSGKVTASSDDRTNTLIVTGPKARAGNHRRSHRQN